MGFFSIYLFSRHPNFPRSKYIMLLTQLGGGKGCDTHSMTIFFELFTTILENDFIKKKINHFGPIIIFFPTITISLSTIIK